MTSGPAGRPPYRARMAPPINYHPASGRLAAILDIGHARANPVARSAFGLVLALLAPLAAAVRPPPIPAPRRSIHNPMKIGQGALQTALANVVITQTGDSSVIARPDVAKAVAAALRAPVSVQTQCRRRSRRRSIRWSRSSTASPSTKMLSRLRPRQQKYVAEQRSRRRARRWYGSAASRTQDGSARVLRLSDQEQFRARHATDARACGWMAGRALAGNRSHPRCGWA